MNHSVICDYSLSTDPSRPPPSARPVQSELLGRSEGLSNWIFVPSEYEGTLKRPSPDSISNSMTLSLTGTQSPPPSSSTPLSASLLSSKPSSTPTTFDFQDFTLHHHYLTSTCYTLAEDDASLHFWRDEAPKLAIMHPFILHLILALAGLHRARNTSHGTLPDPKGNESWLVDRADMHLSVGLRGIASLVGDINPGNIRPAWVGATILCFLPMARGPRPGEYLFFTIGDHHENMAEWPSLVRGVRTLCGISKDLKSRVENCCSSQICGGGKASGIEYQRTLERLRQWVILQSEKQGEVNGWTMKHCYVNAIAMLERMFSEMCGEGHDAGCTIGRLAMMVYDWICCFDPGLSDFQRREPVALVLLAYFLVIMKIHDEVWFARGWAEHIIGGIEECLGREDRRWLQWPMETIFGLDDCATKKTQSS
ncbi:hypothetical protein ASPTUDRAFT_38545 [Aspergillus tubingensis CBS 134.48]|uniref:Uncharacterized protein n=1 Tax=Aspergillus tubingensis (strain CBS 134.48) TaxID=767770 RepID=A0A1L9NQI4_ASPTC|nr:hypothetical protein ASPTUDRAFT_38545 [Aspergillus tubingensis CBS 134.48]